MTNRFEQDYSSYANQLDSYKERALQIKELAMMTPENAAAKIGEEVGITLGSHLANHAIQGIIKKGTGFFEKTKANVNETLTNARAKVNSVVDRVEGATDNLKRSIDEKVDSIQSTSKEVQGAVQNDAGVSLRDASARAGPEYNQEFQNRAFDPESAPEPEFSDAFATDGGNAFGLQSDEVGNTFSSFYRNSDPIMMSNPELSQSRNFFSIPRPQAGTTSNRLGDLLSQQRQQEMQQSETPEIEMQDMSTQKVASGETLPEPEPSGVKDLESTEATDVEQTTTEVETGVETGVEGELTTEEAVAGALAPETGGLSEAIGAVVAVGTILGSIFGAHHSSPKPPPVSIPTVANPVFTAGLASN